MTSLPPVCTRVDLRQRRVAVTLGRYRQRRDLRYREVFVDGKLVGAFLREIDSAGWHFGAAPDASAPPEWLVDGLSESEGSLSEMKRFLRDVVQSEFDACVADALAKVEVV